MSLVSKTNKTIQDLNMIQMGESVLIAVSGGPDSVALTYVLKELSIRYRINLGIAHFNHLIRENSQSDEDFVELLAGRINLPLYKGRKNIPQFSREIKASLEEAGRIARYEFLDDLSDRYGYDKIATGHNCDDNAEQVLMNLFRGAGMTGLSGIPPVRGRIVRPLIRCSRRMIMDFLDQQGRSFVMDASNADIAHLRNRVRRIIIPQIEKYCNPKIAVALNRFSDLAGDEEQWINDLTECACERALIRENKSSMVLSCAEMASFHVALQRRIIRKGVMKVKGNLRRIHKNHIDSAIRLIKSLSSPKHLHLPDRIRISTKGNEFHISKEKSALRRAEQFTVSRTEGYDYHYEIWGEGELFIPEIGTKLVFWESAVNEPEVYEKTDGKTARLDLDRIQYPLVIRPFKPGDRFRPLGMAGTRKVNRFFSDRKINPDWRRKCPLVINEDTIVWIAGYRIADSVKTTKDTKRILMIELSLA